MKWDSEKNDLFKNLQYESRPAINMWENIDNTNTNMDVMLSNFISLWQSSEYFWYNWEQTDAHPKTNPWFNKECNEARKIYKKKMKCMVKKWKCWK